MDPTYERYKGLDLDASLICLERPGSEEIPPYFCYPLDARPIGFEGCILYCFLAPYGDMVFACDPETCADRFVYPLARSFEDFLRLILACGSANPVEQIAWMSREQFLHHLQEEETIRTDEQKALLHDLAKTFGIAPIDDPYDYVTALQATFDDSKIEYRAEYFEVTGLERP